MISAIRTVCRVLDHTPHELPADLALLNRLLCKALPAAAEDPLLLPIGHGLPGS